MNNYWWFYFVLTCLISWPVWGLGKLLLPENLRIITSVIGAFGPFVAAIIMQRRTGGKAGLRAWLKTTFNFRIRSSSSERYKFREK